MRRDCSARTRLARIEQAGHPFSVGLILAALGEADGALAIFQRIQEWYSFAIEQFRYLFPDVLGPLRADPLGCRVLHNINRDWGWEPGAGEAAGDI